MDKKAKLEIVPTKDEGEAAGWLLCSRVSSGPASAPGAGQENCSVCGELVWVAKTSPSTPPRICLPCALPQMQEALAKDELTVLVSQATLEEAAAAMAKPDKSH